MITAEICFKFTAYFGSFPPLIDLVRFHILTGI